MIKVLEGDRFQIEEFVQDFIDKKFIDVPEEQRKYSIIRNPKSISAITNHSILGSTKKIILWDFKQFKELKELNLYIVPKETDVFIIGGSIDKRLTIVKSLQAFQAEFKEFKKLYPNQVESWILQKKDKLGLRIQPDAIKMLAFMYGTNLLELNEFLLRLKKQNKIVTKQDVMQDGSTVNEFSIFELQDEITARRLNKAIFIARQMYKNGEQLMGIIRYFVNFFEKLIIIKTRNKALVDSLKIHPYILKKLGQINLSIEDCFNSLDVLRKAELQIYKGFKDIYILDRLVLNLCKIKEIYG